MVVTRLHYHSDPYPATGAYEQVSPRLGKLLLQRMEPLLELDGCDVGTFSYSRLPDGIVLISRKDGSSAQALCLDGESADLGRLLPLDLWRSPLWNRWEEGEDWKEDAALPQGKRLDRNKLVDALRRAEAATPGRLERFLTDVKALFAREPGRQIILIAQPADIACFIQVACESLRHERASRLTFTSRSADPRTAYQQIVGVPDNQAIEFATAEIQHQYRVHDIITGRQDSPANGPDSWARTIARQWLGEGGPKPRGGVTVSAGGETTARTFTTPEEMSEALHSTPPNAAAQMSTRADLAAVPGRESALGDASSSKGSHQTLSAAAALDLIATLKDRQRDEPLDEELLECLVAAAIQAPMVDAEVLMLNSVLLGLELRPVHRGALLVLRHADRLGYERDVGSADLHMRGIAESLRERTNKVEFSAEVERWWINQILDTLFYPGPDRLWIKTASYLAQCDSKKLLHHYVELVRMSPRIKEDLIRDPELLSEVMAVWQRITSENPYWETARRQLSAFADEVHGPHSRKTKKARKTASQLVSEWEGGAQR